MFFCCRRKNYLPITHFSGFLPKILPHSTLVYSDTHTLTGHINAIAHELPKMLKEKRLIRVIDTLNTTFSDELLVIENAEDSQDRATATLMLTMIAQAYIFQDPDSPQTSLPPVLSKNLLHLCKEREVPILTYDDYVLHNFKLKKRKEGFKLDNIEPLFTFTGSKDEAGFIKIHVAIEAAFSDALASIQKMGEVKQLNIEEPLLLNAHKKQIYLCLQQITDALKTSRGILLEMHKECDPEFFSKHLRQRVSGWKSIPNKDAQGNDQPGVKLIDEDGSEKLYAHQGPSGAQSSILPTLDAFLGVSHDLLVLGTLHDFKPYMPKKDRDFIQFADTYGLKRLKQNNLNEKDSIGDDLTQDIDLNKAYKSAIDQLEAFRAIHKTLVHKFVAVPASKKGISSDQLIGTGGTNLTFFLRALIKATRKCKSLGSFNAPKQETYQHG